MQIYIGDLRPTESSIFKSIQSIPQRTHIFNTFQHDQPVASLRYTIPKHARCNETDYWVSVTSRPFAKSCVISISTRCRDPLVSSRFYCGDGCFSMGFVVQSPAEIVRY